MCVEFEFELRTSLSVVRRLVLGFSSDNQRCISSTVSSLLADEIFCTASQNLYKIGLH